ncbi:putative pentatricopeptide repeat-containing protein [Camellia lanceoleosa]|uniref:Pentatricopeptide repeat-containing protein n=1 Tax=Camellia lanceoleosa TaxID=1840588 RepID=A0ACC0J409_9ERIC|nr:putative pentatricopeptide repeat-containing protein [Camellia lanceoleosa]
MMNGVWKIIHKMLLNELNPNSVTYKILICGHCQTGNIEEGFKLWEEMLSQGFQLNDISYSVLLSSLCKMGRIGKALSLLHEMESIGLKPDLITYSILIHGLSEARTWLDTIKAHGLVPNAATYTTLMNALCEEGNICGMFEVLNEMEASDDMGQSHYDDGYAVCNSKSQMLPCASDVNTEFLEMRNGVICCTLNTKETEILSNDDIFLPNQMMSFISNIIEIS